MAFGRYQSKQRLLAENLAYSLEKNAKILHVCAILHNFVFDNNSSENEDDNNGEDAIVRTINPPLKRFDYLPSVARFDPPPGSSTMRDIIVRHLGANEKVRPAHNVGRNMGRQEVELEDIDLM